MFYYLEDKYGVKFIINDSFNIKNNIESLYLARKELKNTYICVSDSYYIENPLISLNIIHFIQVIMERKQQMKYMQELTDLER